LVGAAAAFFFLFFTEFHQCFLTPSPLLPALLTAGFALQSSGFESGVDEKFDKPLPQKPEVIATLKRLVGLGPAILLLVSFVPAYFYPINRESLAETQLALAEIKKAGKATPKRYASGTPARVVHAAI
jgi:Na+/melibiose symporter-like transporter